MLIVVLVVLGVALVAMYLSWTAGRLDRLHNRTDAARAALDAQLVRRAAAAAELARGAVAAGVLPAPAGAAVVDAAARARAADRTERVAAEDRLSTVLRATFSDAALIARMGEDPALAPLLGDLEAAMTTVVLAGRFYSVAVDDTLALRGKRVVRGLRLAGSAPLPTHIHLDDTPVPLGRSAVGDPR